MLKLRLTQTGSKNRRTFRIVAMEESKRRNGKPTEILGYYNPLVKPAQFKVDMKRIEYWKAKGAQVTPGLAKLLT